MLSRGALGTGGAPDGVFELAFRTRGARPRLVCAAEAGVAKTVRGLCAWLRRMRVASAQNALTLVRRAEGIWRTVSARSGEPSRVRASRTLRAGCAAIGVLVLSDVTRSAIPPVWTMITPIAGAVGQERAAARRIRVWGTGAARTCCLSRVRPRRAVGASIVPLRGLVRARHARRTVWSVGGVPGVARAEKVALHELAAVSARPAEVTHARASFPPASPVPSAGHLIVTLVRAIASESARAAWARAGVWRTNAGNPSSRQRQEHADGQRQPGRAEATHPPSIPRPRPPARLPQGPPPCAEHASALPKGIRLPVVKCNPFIRTHHDTREGFVHQYVSLNLEVDLVTIKFVACKCRQYKIRIQNVFPSTKP